MEKLTKQFLLNRGFTLVGNEYGGTYVMHDPDKDLDYCDEIEVLIDDDCFHIKHYFNSHKELGFQEEIYNKIDNITNTTDMFFKTLEVLGLDDEWIKSIKDNTK